MTVNLNSHTLNSSIVNLPIILQFVTRSDTVGGVHVHIIDLITKLSQHNVSSFVVAGPSKSGILFDKLDSLSIPFIKSRYLRAKVSPFYDILAFFELSSLILSIKPSLVHIHSSKIGLIGRLACFFTFTPCIFTVHGWSYSSINSPTVALFYKCLEFFLQFIPRKIICVSQCDYHIGIHNYIRPSKLSIIHNTSTRFPQHNILPNEFHGSPRLLTVARLDHQKDHKTLISALSDLPQSLNWSLDVVGDGPLFKELFDLVNALNLSHKVNFIGYVDDPSFYYQKSDLFVLSSNWEGLPLTVIEAFAYGLPVISSNVGGCNELICNGFNGFLFPRNSRQHLGYYLSKVLSDQSLMPSLSHNASLTYRKLFSPSIFYDSTFSIYSEILSHWSL